MLLVCLAIAFAAQGHAATLPAVVVPAFQPGGGTYPSVQTVKISVSTADAQIYYTTDGTTPTISSSRYEAAIAVAGTMTVRAMAIVKGGTQSAESSATYTISPPAATPVFSIAAGTYSSNQTVSITDSTPGATVYYTITGLILPMPSARYVGPIEVSAAETINAIAIAPGFSQSAAVSATYAIVPLAATPSFSVAGGTYTSNQTVSIIDCTPGAAIYFTITGQALTMPSTLYTGPIAVSANETINAVAVAPSYSRSVAASATYTIAPLAAAPVFSLAAGTYLSSQTVNIADSTPGATIYYTVTGPTQTASSLPYIGLIVVSATETVTAVATAPGYSQSAPVTATYNITPPAAMPVLMPAGGRFATAQTVSIACTTPGGTVFYTTNGMAPTAASTPYAGPIEVSASENIQAVVIAPGYAQSPVASATFSIEGALNIAAPSTMPQGFSGANYVATIQASGEGPSYAWTVNGTPIPNNSSPITVASGITASSNGSYLLTIGGKPALPGPVTLSIGVTDNYTGDQAGPVSFSIVVNSPPSLALPAANPTSLGSAIAHQSYMGYLGAIGGVPPYAWTVTGLSGTLTSIGSTPIITLAGNGSPGFSGDSGPASAAQIGDNGGIAVDALGNVYFADSASSRVRMVSPAGIISTVAGTGSAGYNGDNIAASDAQLNSPVGLAVDRAGNLYIADAGNARIRMVSAATGQIATVAGTGIAGYNGDGLAATSAELNWPTGVALDCLGNLYVADSRNARLREVPAMTGAIATVAGSGAVGFGGDGSPAANALLNNPYALAVDIQGNIYIADLTGIAGASGTSGRIRVVAASNGIINTMTGNGAQGFNGDGIAAIEAELNNPISLAVDRSGNLYIADAANNRIRSVNEMAVIGTVAGAGATAFNGDNIAAIFANIDNPQGVAADGAGNIYIADGNSRIRVVQAPAANSELVIEGTPSSVGPIAFQASIQDSTGASAGPVSYSINVTAPLPLALPIPNPASLPSAIVGQPYNGSVVVSGGVPVYAWTVNGGPVGPKPISIPGGIAVSSAGNTLFITGTPAATGLLTFRAWVKDGLGLTAGPTYSTYSIDVVSAAGSQVSGQVNFVNCGAPTAGVTLTLNTNPPQVASTDSSGIFSFENVPNGTYAVTPSISAPSSIFYPSSQTLVVNGNSIAGIGFQAAIGYTVSGSVGNTEGVGGRIYMTLTNTSCPQATPGTSISGPEGFSIRGVQPGAYTLQAWVDELGYGAPNAQNPAITIPNLTVGSANLQNISMTFIQPPPVSLTSPPAILFAGGFGGGAILGYAPILANGVEQAASYTVQWSTSASFSSITGSRSLNATGAAGARVWLLNGLPSRSIYYFRAQGATVNSGSPWSNVFGPVIIGAPAAGNTVSGAVSFTGYVKGALYVGFRDQNTGLAYAEIILHPASPQAYSVMVPTGSNYAMFALIDQNGNSMADNTDINGMNDDSVVAIAGNTTENMTLPVSNVAFVATQHYRQAGQTGTYDSYGLAFRIPTANMMPQSLSLLSGPNVLYPLDIGECTGCGGEAYNFSLDIGSAVPNPGDAYGFGIQNPSGNLTPGWGTGPYATATATVTGVVNAFATNLSPATGSGAGTTPEFDWADPPNAGDYTYQFTLWDANGNVIWQIPAANTQSSGFSSDITSIVWGADPTGAGNPPSVASLTAGETYLWSIQVEDSNGNTAVTPVSYTP